MREFHRSLAVVVGVDAYQHGIPPLANAVRDAQALAQLLEREHGYAVTLLTDQAASREALQRLFEEHLPDEVEPNDRLLLYFAGHGVALDGEQGPEGFLLPYDAHPLRVDSFLPMKDLHAALSQLRCRHFLGIFDCCFAGAFRWFSTRSPNVLAQVIHRERYERFVQEPAWQVLTSAAHDERALDVVAGNPLGERGGDGHSPFAQALLDGLGGEADIYPPGKGLITATELHWYVRERVLGQTGAQRQTPLLWPLLGKHDRGEYVFQVPGRALDLPPAPELRPENNPYRGLAPFDEAHSALFFGRERHIQALLAKVLEQPLTVVVAPSGAGKSSLVRAGLAPRLRAQGWMACVMRPGVAPLRALAEALGPLGDGDAATLAEWVSAWRQTHSEKLLLIIDQFEELLTLSTDEVRQAFSTQLTQALNAHAAHVRVVLTVRADFEPQFAGGSLAAWWPVGRTFLPPMTQDELREAIEDPALACGLYFDPPQLVDRLINEVVHAPGALPLLSFTLSELYLKCAGSGRLDRALSERDYEQLGGVIGALRQRADAEYGALEPEARETMRRMLLRMVSLEGGDLARRRLPLRELVHADSHENEQVEAVLQRLTDARLVVRGSEGAEPFVEPAHDELIRGWAALWRWVREAQERLPVQRNVARAAASWQEAGHRRGYLWDKDPRLPQLEQLKREEPHALNALESLFVRASARRRRRALLQGVGAALAVIAALVGFSIFTLFQREEAERLRMLSLAQALAAQASLQADTFGNGQLGMLLARQALLFHQAAGGNTLEQMDEALRTSSEHFASETLTGHEDAVNALAFSPDGCRLASGGRDRTVRVWNVCDLGAPPLVLDGHAGIVNALAFSPDGQLLASGGADGQVRLWRLDPLPDKEIEGQVLQGAPENVKGVAFGPDGHTLAAAGWAQQVVFWALEDLEHPLEILTPADATRSYYFTSLAFSLDGRTLAVGNQKGGDDVALVRLWRRSDAGWLELPTLPEPEMPTGEGFSVAFSPDGHTLAVGGMDCTDYNCEEGDYLITVWRVDDELLTSQATLKGHLGKVQGVAFDPQGRTLASVGEDGTVMLWDLQSHEKPIWAYHGEHGQGYSLAYSADGRFLAAGFRDGTVRVWGLAAAAQSAIEVVLGASPLFTAKRSGAANALAVATSPDGRWLAAAGWDRMLHLWALQDLAAAPRVLSTRWWHIRTLAFVEDGESLLALAEDGTAIFWDLATMQGPYVLAEGIVDMAWIPGVTAPALFVTPNQLVRIAMPAVQGTVPVAENLALYDQVNVSAQSEFSTKPAINAVDGDIATAWAGGHAEESWLQASLDRMYSIGRVGVQIGAHTLTFDVQVSVNGSDWITTAQDVVHPGDYQDPTQSYRSITFQPVNAQYVRLRIRHTNAPPSHDFQYIIHELEVFPEDNPHTFGSIQNEVYHFAQPPDAAAATRRWAAWLEAGVLWVLNLETPNATASTLTEASAGIHTITLTPDGRWLAAATDQGDVQLWNLQQLDAPPLSLVSVGEVNILRFNDDGTILAAGGDGTIWFWNLVQSPSKPIRLVGHRGPVQSLAFLATGVLVSSGYDGTMRLWALTNRLSETVCNKAWRNLTQEEWVRFVGIDIPYQRTCDNLP